MLEHVGEQAADVGIRGRVEHLLALALGLDDAGRAQQAQVVADQRTGQVQRGGDVAHRDRLRQAGEHDAQARGVAQQVEQVGEFVDGVVGVGWDTHL